MNQKTNIEKIINAIGQMIDGEPLPSVRSDEFKLLVDAANFQTCDSQSLLEHRAMLETIGMRTVTMLLERMSASMHAERELAILRDKSNPLC